MRKNNHSYACFFIYDGVSVPAWSLSTPMMHVTSKTQNWGAIQHFEGQNVLKRHNSLHMHVNCNVRQRLYGIITLCRQDSATQIAARRGGKYLQGDIR